MHEVTNDGTDRSQLSHVANETKAVLGLDKLDAVADRGYFNSEEIRACEEAGITVTLPKPMTSNAKAYSYGVGRLVRHDGTVKTWVYDWSYAYVEGGAARRDFVGCAAPLDAG